MPIINPRGPESFPESVEHTKGMQRIAIGTPETVQYRDPELDQTEYREFLEAAKQRAIEAGEVVDDKEE